MIVVCGAGGFIGGHLVQDLLKQGDRPVRAVDIKPLDEWYQVSAEADNLQLDLSEKGACERALYGASEVYNLAADMGGMGFIENNKALCMLTVLINTHLLMAAQKFGVKRFFFSSSACIYPAYRQTTPDVVALKESDAYPAMPKMVTGGKSCLVSACAVTIPKTLDSSVALFAITMFMDLTALTMAVVKRLLLRFAAR